VYDTEICDGAYTMTATNHDGLKVYHNGHSNENAKKGVLLRNRQIHDIVGQLSPSYVFGYHGLWP